MNYLDTETLSRSIWVQPCPGTIFELKKFFEETLECGIVVNIRKRKGHKWINKTGPNEFAIVEFANVNSVTRALHAASRKETKLLGVAFRVYKAGTGTFICKIIYLF